MMLIKSFHWRARHSTLSEPDLVNVCLVLDAILRDMTGDTRVVWPWRGCDHRTLLRNYEAIAGRLRERDPAAFTDAVLDSARSAAIFVAAM